MPILKILLWGIVLYYLYKFVFNIVVPVGKATNQMKSKIKEMQDEQLRQQQAAQQKANTPPPVQQQKTTTSTTQGDYIEFEEVK